MTGMLVLMGVCRRMIMMMVMFMVVAVFMVVIMMILGAATEKVVKFFPLALSMVCTTFTHVGLHIACV